VEVHRRRDYVLNSLAVGRFDSLDILEFLKDSKKYSTRLHRFYAEGKSRECCENFKPTYKFDL
jgi:hypothetical protein